MSDDKQAKSSPWDELRRIADEVKVKLHLAGMEAKEKWHATYEPKLQELQQKAEAQGERAAGAVQEQLVTFADALKKFAADLRTDLDTGRKKPDGDGGPAPDKSLDSSG